MIVASELVAKYLNDCDFLTLGVDLFTGSHDDMNSSCECGKCNQCIHNSLVYIQQDAISSISCLSTRLHDITITVRTETGSRLSVAYSLAEKIHSALKKVRSFGGYRIHLYSDSDMVSLRDNSNRQIVANRLQIQITKEKYNEL